MRDASACGEMRDSAYSEVKLQDALGALHQFSHLQAPGKLRHVASRRARSMSLAMRWTSSIPAGDFAPEPDPEQV
jgi:hypothetical protein